MKKYLLCSGVLCVIIFACKDASLEYRARVTMPERGADGAIIEQNNNSKKEQNDTPSVGQNNGERESIEGVKNTKIKVIVPEADYKVKAIQSNVININSASGEINAKFLQNELKQASAASDVYNKKLSIDEVSNKVFGVNVVTPLSETVPPPYVFAFRRQTDYLVRQAWALLPDNVRSNTAYIYVDRFMQQPEAYLDYLKDKGNILFFTDFVGIGSSEQYPDWAKTRHGKTLNRLELFVSMLNRLNLKGTAIFAMGDSPTTAGMDARKILEQQTADICSKSKVCSSISWSWGADELPLMAFAKSLPNISIYSLISNKDAQQHYDGKKRLEDVYLEKLQAVGINEVEKKSSAQVYGLVLGRKVGGAINDWSNDSEQIDGDIEFINRFWETKLESERNKTIFIDSRIFNGAWSFEGLPKSCDGLVFASWGTTGNKVGSALAIGKILFYANNAKAREQLWLEAFAHDVFANGYKVAQRGELRDLVNATGVKWNHWAGYESEEDTQKVFGVVNEFVNKKMNEFYKGTSCMVNRELRFHPQLWRTFESEVHLIPALDNSININGVFWNGKNQNFKPLQN